MGCCSSGHAPPPGGGSSVNGGLKRTPNSASSASITTQQASKVLTRGAEVMLLPRFGKGKPRAMFLYLVTDGSNGSVLRWADKQGAKPRKDFVSLSQVVNMHDGQFTRTFQAHQKRFKDVADQCWSLILADATSLDVVMAQPVSKRLWLVALRTVLEQEAPAFFSARGGPTTSKVEEHTPAEETPGSAGAASLGTHAAQPGQSAAHAAQPGQSAAHAAQPVQSAAHAAQPGQSAAHAGQPGQSATNAEQAAAAQRNLPSSQPEQARTTTGETKDPATTPVVVTARQPPPSTAEGDGEAAKRRIAAQQRIAEAHAALEEAKRQEAEAREAADKAAAARAAEERAAAARAAARAEEEKLNAVGETQELLKGITVRVEEQLGSAGSYTGHEVFAVVRAELLRSMRSLQQQQPHK